MVALVVLCEPSFGLLFWCICEFSGVGLPLVGILPFVASPIMLVFGDKIQLVIRSVQLC